MDTGVKKYFIAIVIPEPLRSEIEAIKCELLEDFGLKGALRSPAHITLHRPFEWKLKKEAELISRLEVFTLPETFSVLINGFGFFEPRVVYAAVQENASLIELHRRLTDYAKRELHLFNEAEDRRGFHPHITVAFRDLRKPVFYQLQHRFAQRLLKGAFECRAFSLLRLENTWQEIASFGDTVSGLR